MTKILTELNLIITKRVDTRAFVNRENYNFFTFNINCIIMSSRSISFLLLYIHIIFFVVMEGGVAKYISTKAIYCIIVHVIPSIINNKYEYGEKETFLLRAFI